MALKDFQQTGHRAGVNLRPSIGVNLQLALCVVLLLVVLYSVSAQARSDSATYLAKFAMKLPEKQLLRMEPKVIRLPTGNQPQVSGLSDGTGSAISGRNSLGAGLGEYAWKQGIATTVFWVGEQASVNNPVSNDKSAWDAGWVSSYGGMDSPNAEDRLN